MTAWRRSKWADPARWYLLVGVALLATSIWVPFLTAERTARTEQRADQIAAALLQAVNEQVFPLDDETLPIVLARCYCLAASDGQFVGDLEPIDEAPADVLLCLQNKHYLFHLAVSPPDQAAVPGRGTVPSYEVMAWPRERIGPAHSAFFYPDNALRAYSRNLAASHYGMRRRPAPGTNHRRAETLLVGRSYRSADDERWIPF